MTRSYSALLTLVLLVFSLAGLAQTKEEKDKAKKLFAKGVALYEQGKFAAALENFNASYELLPYWKISYNIGKCYLQLGDPTSAATKLSLFIEEGGADVDAAVREEVTSLLKDLRAKLGVIRLTGHYEGGLLLIDGLEAEMIKGGQDVFLTPGVHEIMFSKEDVEVLKQKVTVEAGEEKELFIVEAKTPVVKAPEEPPGEPVDKMPEPPAPKWPTESQKKMRIAGWVFLGLAAASLAAGAVTGGLVIPENSLVEDAEKEYEESVGSATPAELQAIENRRDEHYDKAMQYAVASTALFAAAGAAVVVTAVLLPLSFKGKREKKAGFQVQPGVGSLSLSVSF